MFAEAKKYDANPAPENQNRKDEASDQAVSLQRKFDQMRKFNDSIPLKLLKARETTMSFFRPILQEAGLTEQQWRVIRTLAAYQKIDASEIARKSFLLAPSLTRILQFLERAKLIKRSSDANDQRRSVFRAVVGHGRGDDFVATPEP